MKHHTLLSCRTRSFPAEDVVEASGKTYPLKASGKEISFGMSLLRFFEDASRKMPCVLLKGSTANTLKRRSAPSKSKERKGALGNAGCGSVEFGNTKQLGQNIPVTWGGGACLLPVFALALHSTLASPLP